MQLRSIIEEELNEVSSLSQAKLDMPMKRFMEHMKGAKQALSEMFQATQDGEMGDSVQSLLNGVNRLTQAAADVQRRQATATSGSGTFRRS